MKYVKLFESWLNTVNEGTNVSKRYYREMYDKYQIEEANLSGVTPLANFLAKKIAELTKNYETPLKPKSTVKGSKDIIIELPDNKGKFSIFFEKGDPKGLFSSVSGVPENNMLCVKGKGSIPGQEPKDTTLAQFIYTVMEGGELEEEYDNPENKVKAVEALIQSSIGIKPVMKTPAVAKMTCSQFEDLTKENVDTILRNILKIDGKEVFQIARIKDSDSFLIDINPAFAKSQKINFIKNSDDQRYGGRYLALNIKDIDSEKDAEKSVANWPVSYGYTQYREGTSFGVELLTNERGIKPGPGLILSETSEPTTLAAFVMGLRKFAKDGMKKDGKTVANSVDFLSASSNEIKNTDQKQSEDAWKKEGGPADMTLGASEPKGEATA